MFRRTLKIALVAMGLLSLGLVALLPTSVGKGGFNSVDVDAAASCPPNQTTAPLNGKIHVGGSGTVSPIAIANEGPWAAVNTGTSYDVAETGSGDGVINTIGATPTGLNLYDVGESSRDLTASEQTKYYLYQIAGDEQIVVVSPDVKALFASQAAPADISRVTLKSIYNGSFTDWNQVPGLSGLSGTHTIVPRARILGSGSRDDFLDLIGVDKKYFARDGVDGVEVGVINATAQPRLTASLDVANAVTGGSLMVGYASLGQLAAPIGTNYLTLEGVTPSTTTYINGTYVSHRQLKQFVPNQATRPRLGPGGDDSVAVKADDIIRYSMSTSGEAAINAEGYVPFTTRNPIPSWDVNIDGKVSLGDLGSIAARWGLASACNHWIRADAAPVGVDHDGDASVDIGDINLIFSKWGQAGFIYP